MKEVSSFRAGSGWAAVMLPDALVRKYRHADRQWSWQWVVLQRNRRQDAAKKRSSAATCIQVWFKRS
jgi:hypothetical protein